MRLKSALTLARRLISSGFGICWRRSAGDASSRIGPTTSIFAPSVRYARHLQSIDEGRADFKRVPWGGSGTVTWADRGEEPDQFDQKIWFAGNHADIGGSYPENELRLSDITLHWMVEFITQKIPEAGRIFADPTLLRLYPAYDGMMHDECMVGIGGSPLHWSRAVREVPDEATFHETVYERLALPICVFTSYGPYRPAALRNHSKAKRSTKPSCPM